MGMSRDCMIAIKIFHKGVTVLDIIGEIQPFITITSSLSPTH